MSDAKIEQQDTAATKPQNPSGGSSLVKWIGLAVLLAGAGVIGGIVAQTQFNNDEAIDALKAQNTDLEASLSAVQSQTQQLNDALKKTDAKLNESDFTKQLDDSAQELAALTKSQNQLSMSVDALEKSQLDFDSTNVDERLLEIEQKLSGALIKLSEIQPSATAPNGQDAATSNQLADLKGDIERIKDILTRVELTISNNSQDIVTLTEKASAQDAQIRALNDALKDRQQSEGEIIDALFVKADDLKNLLALGGKPEGVFSELAKDIATFAKFRPTSAADLKNLQDQSTALNQSATEFIPSITALHNEFAKLAHSIIQADKSSPAPVGFEAKLSRQLLGLVNARPVGLATGDDTMATVARIEYWLSQSNLNQAVAQWQTLPDTAQQPALEWHKKLIARYKAQQFLSQFQKTMLLTARL